MALASLIVEQLLNGVQFGVMLFLIAAGLTLVLGIMDVINLAHGSLYMIGAIVAATILKITGSFLLAVLLALPITAVVGAFIELIIIRHLYNRSHLDQVLATFGLILLFDDLVRLGWGPYAIQMPLPAILSGTVTIPPGFEYPAFRFVVLAAGLSVAAALYVAISKTRAGMWVRAGASNRVMASALGVNVRLVFALVFAVGAALAGFAGTMTGPLTAVQVGMGDTVLTLAFVVIVIGGIGSVRGAFIGSLAIGILDTFGRMLLPAALGNVLIFLMMALALAWRPKAATGSAPLVSITARPQRASLVAPLIVVVLLATVPLFAAYLDNPFIVRLFTRIVVFATVVVAMNFLLSYCGIVSLLHGALFGIGAYVVGILAVHATEEKALFIFSGTTELAISLALSVIITAIAALLMGMISLRATGIYLIMITLALTQMIFYLFTVMEEYGGADGLRITGKLAFLGYDITKRLPYYYTCLGLLAATLVLLRYIVDSRFGLALRAGMQNTQRIRALGIEIWHYRLVAFVISGAICGLAGGLWAAGQSFVSPDDMSWVRASDFIVMAVLGGIATVWSPVVGVAIFIIAQAGIASWTDRWQLFFGLAIIIQVMLLRGGAVDLVNLTMAKVRQLVPIKTGRSLGLPTA